MIPFVEFRPTLPVKRASGPTAFAPCHRAHVSPARLRRAHLCTGALLRFAPLHFRSLFPCLTPMSAPSLSKSLLKLGLACPIRLKHALVRPALPRQTEEDSYMQQLARGGYMFEKLVKVYHPSEDMFIPKERELRLQAAP